MNKYTLLTAFIASKLYIAADTTLRTSRTPSGIVEWTVKESDLGKEANLWDPSALPMPFDVKRISRIGSEEFLKSPDVAGKTIRLSNIWIDRCSTHNSVSSNAWFVILVFNIVNKDGNLLPGNADSTIVLLPNGIIADKRVKPLESQQHNCSSF